MSQTLHMTVNNVRKILRNILQSYSYKITHVQELLPATFPWNFLFEWKWTIDGYVIFCVQTTPMSISHHTRNCKTWPRDDTFQMQPLSAVCQGCDSTYCLSIFFNEICLLGPVPFTVHRIHYESVLLDQFIKIQHQ